MAIAKANGGEQQSVATTVTLGGEGTLTVGAEIVQTPTVNLGGEGTLSIQALQKQPITSQKKTRYSHQQSHNCTMEPTPPPTDSPPPSVPGQRTVGWTPIYVGYVNPMDQPSTIQNRTTDHPYVNTRQRHPTNPIKQLDIVMWQIQNPDTWPDGNPNNGPPVPPA
jgi:hypothetical protein